MHLDRTGHYIIKFPNDAHCLVERPEAEKEAKLRFYP